MGLDRNTRLGLAATLLLSLAGGACHYAHAPAGVVFAVCALALCGVAWVVTVSTETLSHYLPTGLATLIQSTAGNAAELGIAINALRIGEAGLVEASLLGSIMANALLVLGITLAIGARAAGGEMRFDRRLPDATATLTMAGVAVLVLLSVIASDQGVASHLGLFDVLLALGLLVAYAVWLVEQNRKQDDSEEKRVERAVEQVEPAMPLRTALILLVVAGILAALVSDWFVLALGPTAEASGLSPYLMAFVVAAIAGNASENAVAFVLAARGQADAALGCVKQSVAQITVGVYPLLVLVSLLFSEHLTFVAPLPIAAAMLLMILLVVQILRDGRGTTSEGILLVVLYALVVLYCQFGTQLHV